MALLVLSLAFLASSASLAQTLRGIAFDSLLTFRPLAGADVWSPTLGRSTTADANGRFSFAGLTVADSDTIELSVHHPSLERMAIPTPRVRVPVAGLSEAAIVVGAPSVETLRRFYCGTGADADAVLTIGRVVDLPAGAAPVRIEALWEELVAAGTSVERRTKAAPAYIRGDAYWVCGAPRATPFALVAQVADGPATIVRVGATQEPVVVRHLPVATAADSTTASGGEEFAISGRVVSRSGDPIGGAEVTFTGRDTVRTGNDGRFVIRLVNAGRRELRVRAVGYEPTVVSTFITPRHRDLSDVALERTVQVLAERAITASASGLRGFEYRRRTGQGYYLTREQIEKRKATTAAQLFTGIPSVWVQQSGTVAIRRSEGQIGLKFPGGCLPVYYIDGVPREIVMPMWTGVVPPDLGPNQFVVPSEIEAIEVYKGLGSIPAEFKKLDAGCGVIVIWTRRGLDGREQPATPR